MVIIAVCIVLAAPIIFGYHPVVVLSPSMEPNYPVGSITYYSPCSYEDVQTQDAITFKVSNSLITHRVQEIDDSAHTFITKGDNNETVDINPVEANQLVGKTSSIAIPYAGYLITFIKNWYVIVGMAVILISSQFLDKNQEQE